MRKENRGSGFGIRGSGPALRGLAALLLATAVWAQETPQKPEEKPEAKAAAADSPAPAAAAAPGEGWIDGYVDLGYRWVTDVAGNFQQYRSVVNLGEGPKLFGADVTI